MCLKYKDNTLNILLLMECFPKTPKGTPFGLSVLVEMMLLQFVSGTVKIHEWGGT